MGRTLAPALKQILKHCEEHTTLKIDMADGTTLRLCSSEETIMEAGGQEHTYLGRLIVSSALKMSLTISADKLSLQIDNTNLELGRALIAVPRALDNCFAMLGVLFKDPNSNAKWLVEKLPGEITTSEINGEVISINFKSELDAANYGGRNISDAFPDAQNAPTTPTPTTNDFLNPVEYIPLSRYKMEPLLDDFQIGRHYLPESLSF